MTWRKFELATHNSWMILSKLITANRREAIAVPAIADRATILMNEAVFFTVDGASGGSEYADDILLAVTAFSASIRYSGSPY
jgi:hypothetical protein